MLNIHFYCPGHAPSFHSSCGNILIQHPLGASSCIFSSHGPFFQVKPHSSVYALCQLMHGINKQGRELPMLIVQEGHQVFWGLGVKKKDYSAACLFITPLQLLFSIKNAEQGGRNRPCRSDSHNGADTITRMLLPENRWALRISSPPALPTASNPACYSIYLESASDPNNTAWFHKTVSSSDASHKSEQLQTRLSINILPGFRSFLGCLTELRETLYLSFLSHQTGYI